MIYKNKERCLVDISNLTTIKNAKITDLREEKTRKMLLMIKNNDLE